MKTNKTGILITAAFILSTFPAIAEMLPDNYKRADDLAKKTADKVFYGNVRPVWIGKTNSFLYENLTPSGTEYMIVDAVKLSKKKAFNQEKFASAFEAATGKKAEPGKLPLREIVFSDKMEGFAFTYDNYNWKCNLKNYEIIRGEKVTGRRRPGGWDWGFRDELSNDSVESPDKQWKGVSDPLPRLCINLPSLVS